MKNMFRIYSLEFKRTFGYFIKQLNFGNTLSKIIKKNFDLREGSFFTLVSDTTIFENVYMFNSGGIKSGMDLLECYISSYINSNHHIKCIFEDVQLTKKDLPSDTYDILGYSYGEELYYIVDHLNKDKIYTYDTGHHCTYLEDAISQNSNCYRELCVLTRADLSQYISKELTFEILEKIVENIEVIIFGAYDGEGIVCWKKNPKEIVNEYSKI